MNQSQTRSPRKRLLSLLLAVVLMIGLLPISAFASNVGTQENDSGTTAESQEFLRIFHLDCGRKYFSVDQIKDLINTASANNYTDVELAVGNDGLRFLLKDMSLKVDGKTYTSDAVTAAIEAGNNQYSNSKNTTSSALSETDMDTIIAYAREKNIRIIPLVNTPGHMDAILSAAKSLTRAPCAYNGSGTTIDVTNPTAVAFTQALLQKYISYFAGKGCQYFNMGADEYANDIYKSGSMGFGQLQTSGNYSYYVTYVNQVAKLIENAGMTPMAFNDGIYFKSDTSGGTFDDNIVVCYWTTGFNDGQYKPAAASFLVGKGHKVINTQDAWYYVLGRSSGTYDLTSAKKGANNTGVTSVPGGGATPIGCMQCLWCDEPSASYSNTEVNNVKGLMQTLSSKNPTYFTEVAPLGPSIKSESGTSLTIGSNGTELTISGVTDGSTVTWTVDNSSVIKLLAAGNDDGGSITGTRVTAVPVGEGTATVTATVDGKAYTIELTVTDPNTEHVYVSVGEISKIFTQSGDVTGNVVETDYNRSVASYTAKYVHTDASQKKTLGSKVTMNSDGTYTGVISDGTNYLVIDSSGNISSTTEIADATEFTVVRNTTMGWFGSSTTTYTIQGNGRYLTVNQTGDSWWGDYTYTLETTSKIENWSYSARDGFSNNSRYLTYSNGWTVAENSGTGFLYSVKDESTQAKDETQITFTGVSVGETSVTIGSTKYVIHVQDKAPTDAMTSGTINLEYWITNFPVYESNNISSSKSATITSTDSRVLTDDGLAVAELAPEHAYSKFDGWKDVYYWQTMRLDKDNQQTTADKDDETSDGTTLTHIRYRNDAWQYKKTADGLWHYFLSTDQLVAYYLQKTEVTKEVTTYVKDWGYKTDSVTPNKEKDESNNYKGQVALTVAVVYPDGTVSPAEGDMYANSTTIFNYWSGRDIGIVAPVNNSDYNIAKITVTDGTRSDNSSIDRDEYDTWTSSDTITWDKKIQEDGKTQWYDETEVWNKSSGTTPMVNGKASNITWSAKNTAKLVLIYLEPVERETNLNVVYWDDNANSRIFQYQIAMKYTQGDKIPSFTTELKGGDGKVIGDTTSWPGKTSGDEGYLPDAAYVTNSSGNDQNISKELGTGMEGISGVYTSGLYEYVSADISEDGKTLTLHYNLRELNAKTFVVDFGLPLQIPASAFGIDNLDSVEAVSFERNDKSVREKDGQYGHGSINTDWAVTYTLSKTLNKTLNNKVAIPVWVTFKNGDTPQQLTVNIIPASNVYYEDSLASFTNGSGVAENATWSTVDNNDQTTTKDGGTDVYQALEELGKSGVYGYDKQYNSSSMLSMGTAHKVTVTSAMAVDSKTWDDSKDAWPTASFTFTGTGFDVISLTDNTSGAILVKVTGENYNKNFLVDNYYGYNYNEETGKWTTDKTGGNNALYQIPVMKVTDLPHGTYNVTIQVFFNEFFDGTESGTYNFWLDAIRIYNPMGDYADYTKDNEGYPQYIQLHDELVKTAEESGEKKLVFIDGAASATIAEYANYGPNNEVYLANGQAISFKVPENSEIASIQIGAKAPKGTATMTVKGENVTTKLEKPLETATEMYYDITAQAKGGQLVTISNTSGSILSLTNLKITYTKADQKVTLSELTAEEQTNAVAMVQALFAAPVETFSPETFQADWGRAVRAGKRATLTVKTSADVESITVDGVTVTSYTTRTERTGWGWWSPKVTYHVFTYTTTAPAQTTDYAVCAVNAEGTASEPITATLTVRPATWWNWWF